MIDVIMCVINFGWNETNLKTIQIIFKISDTCGTTHISVTSNTSHIFVIPHTLHIGTDHIHQNIHSFRCISHFCAFHRVTCVISTQMWYYTKLMMHFSPVFKHGYFAICRNNMTHQTVTTLSDTCILYTRIRPTRTTSQLTLSHKIKIIQMHDTKNITMDKINIKQTQIANTFADFCSP